MRKRLFCTPETTLSDLAHGVRPRLQRCTAVNDRYQFKFLHVYSPSFQIDRHHRTLYRLSATDGRGGAYLLDYNRVTTRRLTTTAQVAFAFRPQRTTEGISFTGTRFPISSSSPRPSWPVPRANGYQTAGPDHVSSRRKADASDSLTTLTISMCSFTSTTTQKRGARLCPTVPFRVRRDTRRRRFYVHYYYYRHRKQGVAGLDAAAAAAADDCDTRPFNDVPWPTTVRPVYTRAHVVYENGCRPVFFLPSPALADGCITLSLSHTLSLTLSLSRPPLSHTHTHTHKYKHGHILTRLQRNAHGSILLLKIKSCSRASVKTTNTATDVLNWLLKPKFYHRFSDRASAVCLEGPKDWVFLQNDVHLGHGKDNDVHEQRVCSIQWRDFQRDVVDVTRWELNCFSPTTVC